MKTAKQRSSDANTSENKIKLEKGWKFAKYQSGSKMNSIAQTKVIKGDTQILMNSLTLHRGFQIKFDRNTYKKYDSIIMKFKKYAEAIDHFQALMRMLK